MKKTNDRFVSIELCKEFLKIHKITYKELKCILALQGNNYLNYNGYKLHFPFITYRKKKVKVIL